MRSKSLAVCIALWSGVFLSGAAACMPRKVAPGVFPNSPKVWGTTDSGPILDGFLDLQGPAGLHAIEHGVDLSHHNHNIRYGDLKKCGASFAILKMDSRFEEHRATLSPLGISVLPYHYLSVSTAEGVDFKRYPTRFTAEAVGPVDAPGALLRLAGEMGRSKANNFLRLYRDALPVEERKISLAGLNGELIVLDVEEHFVVSSKPQQRIQFGRFYAAMLAAWVNRVREELPDAKIIFYTFPDIYTSYLQYAFPSDFAAIHGMPVWLARTRGDASDFDLTSNKALQRICLSSSGGNKCILHQYSHRAVFGVANPRRSNPPPHIDVNRLFHVREVRDATEVQLVRRD